MVRCWLWSAVTLFLVAACRDGEDVEGAAVEGGEAGREGHATEAGTGGDALGGEAGAGGSAMVGDETGIGGEAGTGRDVAQGGASGNSVAGNGGAGAASEECAAAAADEGKEGKECVIDGLCACVGQSCRLKLADFCLQRDGFGCFRDIDLLRTADILCRFGVTDAEYSECDDGTVRVKWTEGSENSYGTVFDAESGELQYAYGEAYVLCRGDQGMLYFARAGTPPPEANCESCSYCLAAAGAAGAAGAPPRADSECSLDAQGRVTLPE